MLYKKGYISHFRQKKNFITYNRSSHGMYIFGLDRSISQKQIDKICWVKTYIIDYLNELTIYYF